MAVKKKAATAKKKVARKKTAEKRVPEKTITKRKKSSGKPAPPAYFLSLSVENVKCFGPKQTIDLSDGKGRPAQWTVILGDNNTGKTTLLQCLAALEPTPITNRFDGNDFWFPAMLGSHHSWFSLLPRESGQRLNLRKFASKEKVFMAYEAFYGVKLNELVTRANTLSFSMAINFVEDGRYRSASFSSSRKLVEICGLICYGYGASRIMGETSLAEGTPDHPSASLFKDDVELINAEEWLLGADYSASKSTSKLKKKAAKKRDQIKEVLINLLPEVDDIRVTEPTKDRPKPRVEFKTPYGWVALNGLSLGYRAMITWMVDLANRMFERYPKSPNPLAEPAVVLVDEIDLHLHPKWQRTLMDYLSERFVNTQFIVTAHSPLVVQAAKNANVVLLKREDDHVVIDNNPQSVRGWRADQILASLFETSGYSDEIEELQNERRKLLSKARLTAKDKKKLKDIESKIGDLPVAETPEDIEAMNIIRRAAETLKK